MLKKIFIYLAIWVLTLTQPLAASARFFDPNDIFTDKELYDANALSRTAIQQFLEAKGSVLKNVTAMVAGVPKLVSEMIYEIGKQYGISQQFLLAKLQHEQALIEKSTATQNMLDWATGYSCIIGQRCNEKYRGIFNQLDAAAATQQIYVEKSKNYNYFGYQLGKESKTKDGKIVKPINQATTNLYIYDPYYGGTKGFGANYWFWRVWNRYFTERIFADGALLKDEAGNYWKVENNKLRQFASADIYLADYKVEDAIPVMADRLSYYQIGSPVEFTNNTIVRASSSNLLYLLSNNTKQRIVDDQALALFGYHLADTALISPPVVDDNKLAAFTEGEPITAESVYPQGLLAQNESGEIFLIKQGRRFSLLGQAVWQINFKKDPPLALTSAEINKYPAGEPVKLRDGAIVKSGSGTFYVISNGQKQAVTKAEIVSRAYGEAAANAAPTASDALLALHESADPIDFINASVPDPEPYVSYADRVARQANASANPPYLAVFDRVGAPKSLKLDEEKEVLVSFRNTGINSWEVGGVILELFDENSAASSFGSDNQIALSKTTRPGEIAEFSFKMKANTPGYFKEWFALEYKDENEVFIPMPGAKVRTEIKVAAPIAAQIVSHTLPNSTKQKRAPFTITVKVKNTSEKQIWTARRTALILTADDGSASPFYDRSDWIDKQVVAVPINLSRIKPGQTGIMKFRLDPRQAPLGNHRLRFTLELRDLKEKVYINDALTWTHELKVVK